MNENILNDMYYISNTLYILDNKNNKIIKCIDIHSAGNECNLIVNNNIKLSSKSRIWVKNDNLYYNNIVNNITYINKIKDNKLIYQNKINYPLTSEIVYHNDILYYINNNSIIECHS